MAVKLFGCFIVFISSSLLGYIYSKKCSKRPNELRDLQGIFKYLKMKLVFVK